MLDALVKAVKDSEKTETIEVRGKQFSTRQIFLPPDEKTVGKIEVFSLNALTDYLNQNVDGHDSEKLFIHISDCDSVKIYEQVGDKFGVRHLWLVAEPNLKEFSFGEYFSPDRFIPAFQSLFTEKGDYLDILNYVSNISATDEIENTDDGVSQDVILTQKINRLRTTIKNPVNLAPIRSFTEIEQVVSPFILRMKKQNDSVVIALFEADNGKWENEARQLIKDYLSEKLTVKIPILS